MIEKKQATWGGFARWVADNYSTLGLDLEERERSKDRLVAASRYVDTERAAFGAIVAAGYAESGAQRLRDLWLSYTSSRGIAAPGADRGLILGPPGLGKLRPAEDVARSIVRDPVENALGMWEFWISGGAGDDDNFVVEDYSSKEGAEFDVGVVRGIIARVYDRGRADGAAEAMRSVAEVADACEMAAEENQEVAGCEAVDGHHDRAKTLAAKGEAYAGIAKMLRSLHPASARGFIEPPDMGRQVRAALEEVATALEKRAAKIDGDADVANREARIGRDSYAARGPNVGEIELRAQATGLREAAETLRERIRLLPPGADRGFIQPPDLGRPGDVGFIEPPDMGRPDAVARLAARFDAADPKWHRLHEEAQRRFSAEGEGEAPDIGREK